MDWLSFFVGGIIGGLFTFLGVKITIDYQKKNKQKEEYNKLIKNRPCFEIVKVSDIKPYHHNLKEKVSGKSA